ncbi:MAG: hypothetical protein AB7G44_06440 [Bacteroidia bacterium]
MGTFSLKEGEGKRKMVFKEGEMRTRTAWIPAHRAADVHSYYSFLFFVDAGICFYKINLILLLLNTKCPPWYLNHIILYLCLTKHSKGLINISSMKGVKFLVWVEGVGLKNLRRGIFGIARNIGDEAMSLKAGSLVNDSVARRYAERG